MPRVNAETSELWSKHSQDKKLSESESIIIFKNNKINYLTDLLCQISNLKPDECISQIGVHIPEYKRFVEQHRISDENRWYQKYKNMYPTFTQQEIVRMVKAGILK